VSRLRYANTSAINSFLAKVMIFTATQVSRSQTSSQEFKAYGAENYAPAVISAARIVGLPTEAIGIKRRFRLQENFGRYVAITAGLTGLGYSDFLEDATTKRVHPAADKLVSLPEVVVEFQKPSETTVSAASQAGYRKVLGCPNSCDLH